MKIKINFLIAVVLFFFLTSNYNVRSQEEDDFSNLELAVFNETTSDIIIQLIPISTVFNGNGEATLIGRNRVNNSAGYNTNYINGTSYLVRGIDPIVLYDTFKVQAGDVGGWNDDMTAGASGSTNTFGTYGYGIYKLLIFNLNTGRLDSALIENDFWEEYNPATGTPGDIYFYISDDDFTPTSTRPYRFYYHFHRSSEPFNDKMQINYDSTNGYYLRSWKPSGVSNNLNSRPKSWGPSGGFELKQFGNAGFDTYSEIFPYDSRIHCDINQPLLDFEINQNHRYPLIDSAANYYEDRNGIIPLNLTIKRRVSTSYSRSIYSYGNPNPTYIVVQPSVTVSILRDNYHDNPNQGYPYNGIVLSKYGNENIGNHLIIKGETSQDTSGKIILGNTYGNDSNNRVVVRSFCKFILEPTAILELGQKNEITVEDFPNATQNGGEFIAQKNSVISTSSNSRVTIGAYSKFINNGANITNSSNFQILVNNGGRYIVNDGTVDSAQHIVNNGANIEVINANLTVGDNSKITFDGSSSYLKLDKFSTVTMGQNAKIIFKNGAYLLGDSTTFKAINSEVWEGLVFENAGSQTEITNCKFYSAKNPISFYNDSNYVWIPRAITNTTFNLPTGGQKCIYAENVFNLLIQNDSFQTNSGTFGVHIKNTFAPWEPMHTVPLNNINIVNNYFKGGTIGMALMNFDFTKYYVYNNKFIGTDNGYFGIITKKVSGSIKENNFVNTNINQALRLDVSNLDLFKNVINGNQDNINVLASTTVNMQPIINSGNFIWTGGQNLLTTSSANNIMFSASGLPLLDWGNNCFSMSGGTGYHLLGTVHHDTTPSLPYYARGNSWSHIAPNRLSNIQYIDTPIVPVINPAISCGLPNHDDFSVVNMNLGTYDTVWSTEITEEIPELEDDEALYNSALYYQYSYDYANAIYQNKSLIDNYVESTYINDAVWNMFACYNQIDTGDATNHDNLFSELKTYLTNKINSGNYGEDFETIAYQAVLMCETELVNFNDALDGYEFLAEFHPDPVVRINASWDYEDLAELLGEGSSQKEENLSAEEYRVERLEKLNKLISGDPVLQKLKNSYDKITIEKYNKTETTKYAKKTISENDRVNMEKKIYSINQQKIIQRSLDNIRFAKTLTKDQKDKRLVEDLIISGGMDLTTDNQMNNNTVPSEYKLHQNYPNPFNPSTTIRYQIPKDGLVQIKVYDIIGREVMTLVNEQKSAGTYETVFNATSFASGIYFYKIQSGNFVETKRMMLIK